MTDIALRTALSIPPEHDSWLPIQSKPPLALFLFKDITPFTGKLPSHERLPTLFTPDAPSPPEDLPNLIALGLPSQSTVERLARQVKAAFLGGARSLAGFTSLGLLPLHTIRVWELLHEAKEGRAEWEIAHRRFTKDILPLRAKTSTSEEIARVITAIERVFMRVGWKAKLAPNLNALHLMQLFEDGFIDGRFVDTVAERLNDAVRSTDIMVVTTDVQWALQQDSDWSEIETSDKFKHLRELEAEIKADGKRRVLVPWHLPAHWALYELDLVSNSIRYGDGFAWRGAAPRGTDLVQLRRLMSRISGSPGEDAVLGAPIDIGEQKDGCSCAIILVNGMERRLDRSRPRWTAQTAAVRRMEWAVKLSVASGVYSCSEFGLPDGYYDLNLSNASDSPDGIMPSSDDEDGHDGGTGLTGRSSDAPPTSPASSSTFPAQDIDDDDCTSDASGKSSCDPDGPSVTRVYTFAPTMSNDQGMDDRSEPTRTHRDLRVPKDAPVRGKIVAFFPRLSKVEVEHQRKVEAERFRKERQEAEETLNFQLEQDAAGRAQKRKEQARERKRRQRAKERERKDASMANSGLVSFLLASSPATLSLTMAMYPIDH
jgi:hypothetical protein